MFKCLFVIRVTGPGPALSSGNSRGIRIIWLTANKHDGPRDSSICFLARLPTERPRLSRSTSPVWRQAGRPVSFVSGGKEPSRWVPVTWIRWHAGVGAKLNGGYENIWRKLLWTLTLLYRLTYGCILFPFFNIHHLSWKDWMTSWHRFFSKILQYKTQLATSR